MAVTIEMQNTGDSRARREIIAGVEHVLSDVAGGEHQPEATRNVLMKLLPASAR
ncbi:MAG: hypothetical protein ABSG08_15000 [Terriglobales bacterium]|jgi:hypothetical protein